MKKYIFGMFLLSVIYSSITLSFSDSLSTDYPFLYKMESKCRVNCEPIAGIYSYNYSLLNDISNKGDIWIVQIDISRDITSQRLDTVGLRFYNSYGERMFREDIQNFGEKVVPVSAAKFPNNRWDAGVANNLSIHMDLFKPMPKPGENVSGIELTSKGLPGIRRLVIEPWFEESLFFPAVDDISELAQEPFSFEKEDSLRNMVNYIGWTVGPYAPPAIFNPSTFIDNITSYTTQSRTLGWIKDQTTANKYLSYFTSAKTSLQQNNIGSTRTTLQRVLQDVNVDSTNNLTSEAYALIRYNTEYLLAQLPQVIVSVPELIEKLRIKLQKCFTDNQIGDRRFVQELDDHLKDAKRNYLKRDSIGCAQELEAFQQSIRTEHNAKPKRHDKRFVEEAYNPLFNDAQYIVELVLILPPRSTASLANQIDALKLQVRSDAADGIIGGGLLVRELVSILDAAKQRLLRKDNDNVALHIILFQQAVRRTYEITKIIPRSKIFVRAEGYISLYYRAGYILEQLPADNESGCLMPKLEPELENELNVYEKEAIK